MMEEIHGCKSVQSPIIDLDKNPKRDSTLFATLVYLPNLSGNGIIRSYDFGNHWDTLITGIPDGNHVLRTELAIAPSDTNILYALTCGYNEGFYALFKSMDGGNSWSVKSARNASLFPGSTQAPNMLGWLDGGYFNLPFIPEDNSGQGTYDLTLIVDPFHPDTIYTGGVNMWGSYDGGSSWNFASFYQAYLGFSVHADQHWSVYHPLTGTLYQAHDGGIARTGNIQLANLDSVLPCVNVFTFEFVPGCYTMPTNWEDLSNGLHITEYYKIGVSNTSSGMVAGGCQDNGSYLLKDGNWSHIYGGDGMEAMIHPTNPQLIYVTNQNGTLNKSEDGGVSFTADIQAPITNSGERGNWVTPYIMHPSDPETLFAGFQNVWKSANGGTTWAKISAFGNTNSPTIKAMHVSAGNPQIIYAARSGKLFMTLDGGSGWSDISAGLPLDSAMILSITSPDTIPTSVFVSLGGYHDGMKVYKSDDQGQTWVNISGSLPNVSANSLVMQRNTLGGITNALYVGTDIGIFYTNDSILQTTNKWVSFSEGMPAVAVNELEINYATQKLYAATYGRGLWQNNLFSPSQVENVEAVEAPEFSFIVYPNPVTNKISIELNLPGSEDVALSVYTSTGKLMYRKNSAFSNSLMHTIDLSKWANGMYFIKLQYGESHISSQFVKN
jgi:hypothetical protein